MRFYFISCPVCIRREVYYVLIEKQGRYTFVPMWFYIFRFCLFCSYVLYPETVVRLAKSDVSKCFFCSTFSKQILIYTVQYLQLRLAANEKWASMKWKRAQPCQKSTDLLRRCYFALCSVGGEDEISRARALLNFRHMEIIVVLDRNESSVDAFFFVFREWLE